MYAASESQSRCIVHGLSSDQRSSAITLNAGTRILALWVCASLGVDSNSFVLVYRLS